MIRCLAWRHVFDVVKLLQEAIKGLCQKIAQPKQVGGNVGSEMVTSKVKFPEQKAFGLQQDTKEIENFLW